MSDNINNPNNITYLKNNEYKISHELLQTILDVLTTCPFSQVFPIIETIQKLQPLPKNENKEETKS